MISEEATGEILQRSRATTYGGGGGSSYAGGIGIGGRGGL